ncbi:GDSL-type esterase/lipase family protein [Kitasatospora sp. NPDC096147]|uniref:GDSL-type esterase/lipase family protein n=1 Tax=Kitasatospora sp. NPDC096147 TaxID=3364093 RepID=UPI0037F33FE4
MRVQFGGTADTVAESASGARIPRAVGTVWDGPSDGAKQVLDLQDAAGTPITQLVADERGYIGPFLGPDGAEVLWLDFGAGRVAVTSTTVGNRLTAHLNALDPHNTLSAISAQKGAAGGLATLDSTGLIPSGQLPLDTRYLAASAATRYPRNEIGVYVPPGWGQTWRTKRAAAKTGTGKAVVAAVGSSTFQGLYASAPHTKGVVGLIASGLQSEFGDGGSGYRSSAWNATTLADESVPALSQWTDNGTLIGKTGSSWIEGSNANGPGAHYLYSTIPGESLTFTVRGTEVRIYTLGKDGSRPAWTYQIDQAAPVTVTDTASTGLAPIVTKVTGLAAGTHTVTIKHSGTNGQYLSVNGVTGENASGVVVNNYGRGGATSATFAAPGRLGWNGGADYPADLLLYCVGGNDASKGVSVDTWSANLRSVLTAVRDGTSATGLPATGDTDVMIVMQHIGKFDNTHLRYQDYCARGRAIAEAFGAAFVNSWAIGRNSWNYAQQLGYWGNAYDPSGSGADPVHMSDAGHAAMAATILPILTN